ncbi:MAG: six-cysteine ranthipeptide SCIFF [Oscillospiraceae bacterium]|nr:six-cysteine ranthipeptide SCIFF [Oscillospiraceae bacterium]
MQRIVTIKTRSLSKSLIDGGCGQCQTSCQSACKTSCGVANQRCENTKPADISKTGLQTKAR